MSGAKISYIKLEEYAAKLKEDIDKIVDHAHELRTTSKNLVNENDTESDWVGTAADAFSASFQESYNDLYGIVTTLSIYQGRLERASTAYAAADKEASQVAASIETPQWAEV